MRLMQSLLLFPQQQLLTVLHLSRLFLHLPLQLLCAVIHLTRLSLLDSWLHLRSNGI